MPLYTDHTDEQLIHLLKDSNEGAFTEIYNRYWHKLYAVATHRLGNEAEAKEVVQDVFYHLWKRRAALQLTHTLPTYLAAAVKFEVINRFAAKKRKQRYLAFAAGHAASAENVTQQQIDFALLQEQLFSLVKALPEKCRLVYQLHREAGYSHHEIAAELGIASKTVEAHLARALRKLRQGLLQFRHLFSQFF